MNRKFQRCYFLYILFFLHFSALGVVVACRRVAVVGVGYGRQIKQNAQLKGGGTIDICEMERDNNYDAVKVNKV